MTGDSMALFPMKIETPMTIRSVIVSQIIPGLLDLNAVAGFTTDTAEPAFILTTEIPTSQQSSRTKQQQETDDVHAFLTACVPASDVGTVIPGPHKNDPPDCIAHIRNRQYTIETAQLMLPTRNGKPNSIGRWKLFEQLRDQLFREAGRLQSRLRQHHGYMVAVWFNLDTENRLPPRGREIAEMVDHLKATQPPGPEFFDPLRRQGAPETIPAGTAMTHNEPGSVGCTWAGLPNEYKSGLRRAIGFDIALAYHETYTRSTLRAELRRIIEQHDDARSEVLVLTVGANTREGMHFPSTGLFADALFDDPSPLDGWTPRQLRAVALHDVEDNRVRWLHGTAPWA